MKKLTGTCTKNAAVAPANSTDIPQRFFAADRQPSLFDDPSAPLPGSINDAELVRAALVRGIRECGKSRETIADEMSLLTGTAVTVRRLNAFTAESREDYRWPAELDRAFCLVVGSYDLLRCRVERAGYRMISLEEGELLELGREFLKQKRANERLQALERRLSGVEI